MLPPHARTTQPADSIPSRHLHSSLNKIKHPVNVVRWTPEGRRLLTGSSSGEFTLWNGTGFNFETIMQAHDVAIRALSYSHRMTGSYQLMMKVKSSIGSRTSTMCRSFKAIAMPFEILPSVQQIRNL